MDRQFRNKLEKELNIEGTVVVRAKGISMVPFVLPGKDILVIEKPVSEIKRYDIVLFFIHDRMILHRVIACGDGVYCMRGDNSYVVEKNIPREDIIGVLKTVIRHGKHIDMCSSVKYKEAVIWNCILPLRAVTKSLRRVLLFFRKKRKTAHE